MTTRGATVLLAASWSLAAGSLVLLAVSGLASMSEPETMQTAHQGLWLRGAGWVS